MDKNIKAQKDLFTSNVQKKYASDAREAAFLLGGIGTGNVSVGARGEFRDWEIFNAPGKGNILPNAFFAIRTEAEGEMPVARVLEAEILPPYSKSQGFEFSENAGLPRLASSEMQAEYPFVGVEFFDKDLPVKVRMEAFTPFIPLNADDSGIPCAVIRYCVTNITEKPMDVSIAGSFRNICGEGLGEVWKHTGWDDKTNNTFFEEEGIKGIVCSAEGTSQEQVNYGDMALMTRDGQVTYKTQWLYGGWNDGMQDFWDDFCEDGRLESISSYHAENVEQFEQKKGCSLGIYYTLEPTEERIFEFVISWSFPNRIKHWGWVKNFYDSSQYGTIRNYYSTLFKNSRAAGTYLLKNIERLEKASRAFHDALFGSTLPGYVIDAVAANITVIRSTTCFRIENGTLLAWEGCHRTYGCCPGSCTHVWNYAQTMAFLFPELERTMREVEFNIETDESGNMAFRTMQVLGLDRAQHHPAADGQMGTLIRLYREWKLSGDEEFLKSVWNNAARALDFAFTYWDKDGDFVMDSQQHNTYDIEFYGPNSLTNSMFYAALKAGAEMAEYLKDSERGERYRKAFEIGSKRMDEMLWGGEYYIQKVNDIDMYRYQYGTGCLSDQVLGQLLAHVTGLGYILPQEHVKSAIKSVFDYNFRTDFRRFNNTQRAFVLNDEQGLVLGTWPHGGRPRLPFIYSEEVWTGVEYQVAAHLIYEGFVEEGLAITKTVRDRHDGYKRNPFCEVEAGNHYARSMASWALLTALSGYRCDLVNNVIEFRPVINTMNFSCFFSCGKAWGVFSQKVNTSTGKLEYNVDVLYGNLDGIRIKANGENVL